MIALWITPSHAFVLFIAGVLAIYCEFIWPGRVLPGLLGSVLVVTGSYFLWRNSPSGIGLVLIGLAVALFVAEALWTVNLVSGMLGTIALTLGSWLLFDNPRRIALALSVPLCVIFGAVTVFLSYGVKRARRNKSAGMDRRQ